MFEQLNKTAQKSYSIGDIEIDMLARNASYFEFIGADRQNEKYKKFHELGVSKIIKALMEYPNI